MSGEIYISETLLYLAAIVGNPSLEFPACVIKDSKFGVRVAVRGLL